MTRAQSRVRYPKEWPGVTRNGRVAEIVDLYDEAGGDSNGDGWICTRGINSAYWDLINLPAWLWRPLTPAAREMLAIVKRVSNRKAGAR